MNLTEEKKAPLRAWDMPMKRNMLTMQVTAGKVAACSELLVWDLYWHYFLNIQSINFLLIFFFPPSFYKVEQILCVHQWRSIDCLHAKKNRTIYNWWLNHWNIFVDINTVNQLLFTTFFAIYTRWTGSLQLIFVSKPYPHLFLYYNYITNTGPQWEIFSTLGTSQKFLTYE